MERIRFQKKEKEKIFKKTLDVLNSQGLVVFPSDTVYGFLVDATSDKAVRKLIAFKNRPVGKPISIFVDSFEMLQKYVKVSQFQLKVLQRILPGPFTIVLPSKGKVSYLIESEKKTLGVRLPAFELIVELVSRFGKPVTATSANISGKGPHWDINSFLKTLSEKRKRQIDLIVDAGRLPFRKPSTVVDLTSGRFKILRKGEVVLSDTRTFISSSAKQTREIGEYLAAFYLKQAKHKGVVFIVEGELGVGKTQLAKGVGKFLGVEKEIISPSFVGFFEYKAKKVDWFYHFDLWGAKEFQEIEEYRIENLKGVNRVIFIEWGERIAQLLEKLKSSFLVYIKMEYKNEKERIIKISQIKI